MPSSYMSQAVSAVRCGVYRRLYLIPKKYFDSIRQIDPFWHIVRLELDCPVTVAVRNSMRTRALTL